MPRAEILTSLLPTCPQRERQRQWRVILSVCSSKHKYVVHRELPNNINPVLREISFTNISRHNSPTNICSILEHSKTIRSPPDQQLTQLPTQPKSKAPLKKLGHEFLYSRSKTTTGQELNTANLKNSTQSPADSISIEP